MHLPSTSARMRPWHHPRLQCVEHVEATARNRTSTTAWATRIAVTQQLNASQKIRKWQFARRSALQEST